MFGSKKTTLAEAWKRLAKILSIKNHDLERRVNRIHKPLPEECRSITHKARIGTEDVYIIAANYEDGTLGKVILYIGKMGHEESVYKSAFDTLSIALQHGVPLEPFVESFKHHRMGLICGPTSNPKIPMANSVIDYVGKWLELKYVDPNVRFTSCEDEERPEPQGATSGDPNRSGQKVDEMRQTSKEIPRPIFHSRG